MWDVIKWIFLAIGAVVLFFIGLFIVDKIRLHYLERKNVKGALISEYCKKEKLGEIATEKFKNGEYNTVCILKNNNKNEKVVTGEVRNVKTQEVLFEKQVKYKKMDPELEKELDKKKELII